MGGNLHIFKRLLAAGLSPLELVRGSSALHLAFGAPEELQNHRLLKRQEQYEAAGDERQLLLPQDIHKIIRAMISTANASGIDLNQVQHATCFGAHACCSWHLLRLRKPRRHSQSAQGMMRPLRPLLISLLESAWMPQSCSPSKLHDVVTNVHAGAKRDGSQGDVQVF